MMLLTMLVAISLPANLESRVKSAYDDIARAKTLLSAGKSKSSSSFLSKAEGKLQSVLNEAPGSSLLKKLDQSTAAANEGDQQQTQSAAAQAAQEAKKIDPSLASKLGVAQQHGDQNPAASVRTEAAQKTGLGEIEDTLKKVSDAQQLLKLGESSQAKSLLDKIPGL